MHDAPLFSAQHEPTWQRHLWRLWLGDVLDLATAVLVGWGGLRALEVERAPRVLAATLVGVWVLLSALGGVTGWTGWRNVLGLRLVAEEAESPGLLKGLARAFTVPVDTLLMPILQWRPLDRLLGIYGEVVPTRRRVRALAWYLPLAGALGAAVYFLVVPTRGEALAWLRSLPGYKCCNRLKDTPSWQCESSLARALRGARQGNTEAQAVVAGCPRASLRAGH